MQKIKKFTVIYYGYARQCPCTIHSHYEYVYMKNPDVNCVFSVWSKMWDGMPVHHERASLNMSLEFLPLWVNGKTLAFETHEPDPEGMQEFVRNHAIPEYNCFSQLTWRVMSYCMSLQNAAKLALKSSDSDFFLFCRPDLRFECDINPHIEEGYDCTSNVGIDWFADGNRRIGQAAVKGMSGIGFLDQMFMANRKVVQRISTLFDSVADMHKDGIEINYETLVGWHMHRGGLRWNAGDLAPISIVRPRGIIDGRLHMLFAQRPGPAVEF